VKEENPALELTAVMLNINRGHNEKLKGLCKSLKDYSEYTARVREYADTMPISEAVEQAICECIQEGILAEFLKQNRAEAKQVSIYEYDEEKHMRQEREASWEDGWEAGIREGEERGREAGRKEGRQEGKLDFLRELIQKKLAKGMSVSEIAAELEEEEAMILELIEKTKK
jgi:predicted transposase YdaD